MAQIVVDEYQNLITIYHVDRCISKWIYNLMFACTILQIKFDTYIRYWNFIVISSYWERNLLLGHSMIFEIKSSSVLFIVFEIWWSIWICLLILVEIILSYRKCLTFKNPLHWQSSSLSKLQVQFAAQSWFFLLENRKQWTHYHIVNVDFERENLSKKFKIILPLKDLIWGGICKRQIIIPSRKSNSFEFKSEIEVCWISKCYLISVFWSYLIRRNIFKLLGRMLD